MFKRNVDLYFDDIFSAIKKIDKYTKDLSINNFVKDTKTFDAVIRNLEIIGEAANKIPENIRKRYETIPWHKMISMRHKVIHEYFGVDPEILWKTIKEDLPNLKKLFKKIFHA